MVKICARKRRKLLLPVPLQRRLAKDAIIRIAEALVLTMMETWSRGATFLNIAMRAVRHMILRRNRRIVLKSFRSVTVTASAAGTERTVSAKTLLPVLKGYLLPAEDTALMKKAMWTTAFGRPTGKAAALVPSINPAPTSAVTLFRSAIAAQANAIGMEAPVPPRRKLLLPPRRWLPLVLVAPVGAAEVMDPIMMAKL